MFYRKTINKIWKELELVEGIAGENKRQIAAQHNRIDKISDYIQEKLPNDIEEKAIEQICIACKRYIDMKLNKQPSKKKGK